MENNNNVYDGNNNKDNNSKDNKNLILKGSQHSPSYRQAAVISHQISFLSNYGDRGSGSKFDGVWGA